MRQYAAFALLSPQFPPKLAAGYYAYIGEVTSEIAIDPAGILAGTLYIDRVTGDVLSSAEPRKSDLFERLAFPGIGERLSGRHIVTFGIESYALAGKVMVAALSDAKVTTMTETSLTIADLDRRNVVEILISALTELGGINARRSVNALSRDDGVGIERVFNQIHVVN